MTKNISETYNAKIPDIIITDKLEHLSNKVLFPKKVQKIKDILAKGGLPDELTIGEPKNRVVKKKKLVKSKI
jgi:hypothetical protein